MVKLFTGFLIGLFAGYWVGLVIPREVFLITCLILVVLAILLSFTFHLGLRDFQEY